MALFDREARITSLLQHPNIVQVIDHNTTADGTEYLVMEYLVGREPGAAAGAGGAAAARRGRRHRRPDRRRAGRGPRLTASFTATSSPTTSFWCPSRGATAELVKILDFGISKVNWGELEPSGTRRDGDGHAANTWRPSRSRGGWRTSDAATDQFALAVIAYEMLTGCNPGMASRIVAPTGLPGQLDSVLARALARSNDERFPSVTEFAAAFRAAALPPPVVLVTPMPVFAARLPRGRHAGRGVRAGGCASGWPPSRAWRDVVLQSGTTRQRFGFAPAQCRWRRPSRPRPRHPSRRRPRRSRILAATDAPEVDARPVGGSAVSVACARHGRRVHATPAVHTRRHAGARAPARGR